MISIFNRYKGHITLTPGRFEITKKIHYEWINITEIISLVGGAFGVLIGFTMIALFEIIYFCCLNSFKRRFNQFRKIRIATFFSIKYSSWKNAIFNEFDEIYKRSEIFILKNILEPYRSINDRLLWIFVTIILFSFSLLFIYSIWHRSFADLLIVSLSNTKIASSTVNSYHHLNQQPLK